jgi:hypothetical protein
LDCLDRQKRTASDGDQNPTKTAYQKTPVAARGAESLWTAAKSLFSMTIENIDRVFIKSYYIAKFLYEKINILQNFHLKN